MTIAPTNRAGRRAAAKKPAAQQATINLDELEREEAPEPFSFIHLGRHYILADPQEMDWRDIVDALGHPELFIRAALSPEDQAVFLAPKTKMPAWKFAAVVKRYREHFGLPDPGELNALPR